MPSHVINQDTPIHKLLGNNPDYSKLRVFGCTCWPNLRAYNDKKLSIRTSKCVFIGYNSSHKGYKCLDQSTWRIYISRDVVFDENIFPFEDSKASATPRTTHHPVLLPTLTKPTAYIEQSLIDTQIPVLTEPVIDNSHVSNGQDNYATNGDPGVSMSPAGDEAAHSSQKTDNNKGSDRTRFRTCELGRSHEQFRMEKGNGRRILSIDKK
jgi:hypothetical protein